MKKRYLVVAVMLLAAVLVLSACIETPPEAIELLRQKYSEISSAASIKQEITITKGNFTQFESVKTYTKTENGYTVKGSEKTINDVDADKPFTEVPIDTTVNSAAGATPSLTLDADYFEAGYKLTETGLNATVKQENVTDVLGVEGTSLKAPTDSLVLEMVISNQALGTVRIAYVSNDCNVVILLTIDY